MSIKRIILKEMDGLEWMDDVQPIPLRGYGRETIFMPKHYDINQKEAVIEQLKTQNVKGDMFEDFGWLGRMYTIHIVDNKFNAWDRSPTKEHLKQLYTDNDILYSWGRRFNDANFIQLT